MADLIYMAKSKWRELLDTIRTKGGTSASMTADQAIAAVEAIETGGGGVDFTPFTIYKTEFTQVEASNNAVIQIPPGYNPVIIIGCIENPSSYVSADFANKITGFYYNNLNNYFGDKDGGWHGGSGCNIKILSAIYNKTNKADAWSSGVTTSINLASGTITIGNSSGLTYVSGAKYTAWIVLTEV